MRHALAILFLSLPALARGPGKHTQDYHQGANASASSSGALARYLTPTGDTVSFSGVTFTRASAGAACTDAAGGITFPASGVPCLEGGYHARPSISDLATFSASFDNAAWTKSNATATANTATAPDGTAAADTLTSTSAGGYVYQAFTSSGGAASISVYARSLTGTQAFAVEVYDATSATALKTTSCTAATSWPTRSDLRCIASVSSTTSGHSIQFRVYPGGTAGTGSIYAWGAQPEWSAFANDYCPSTSTAATCAAEVATVPTPSGMSLTSGCAKVCVTPSWTGSNPSSSTLYWLTLNAASTARPMFTAAGGSGIGAYDGTHVLTGPSANFATGVRRCSLTTWSSATGKLTATDLATATSTNVSGFVGFPSFDSIRIGVDGASFGQPLGSILDSIVIGASPEACR